MTMVGTYTGKIIDTSRTQGWRTSEKKKPLTVKANGEAMIIPQYCFKKDGSYRIGIQAIVEKFINGALTDEEKDQLRNKTGILFKKDAATQAQAS